MARQSAPRAASRDVREPWRSHPSRASSRDRPRSYRRTRSGRSPGCRAYTGTCPSRTPPSLRAPDVQSEPFVFPGGDARIFRQHGHQCLSAHDLDPFVEHRGIDPRYAGRTRRYRQARWSPEPSLLSTRESRWKRGAWRSLEQGGARCGITLVVWLPAGHVLAGCGRVGYSSASRTAACECVGRVYASRERPGTVIQVEQTPEKDFNDRTT